MKDIRYQITFFSEWHCGSGLTSGSDLDQLVIKDRDGFPMIPGKTLKGLLKEAAEEIIGLQGTDPRNEAFITDFFGYFDEKPNEESKIHTKGKAYFTDAVVSPYLKGEADKETVKFFYRGIAATAISEKGIAAQGSLRTLETTIPCSLYAAVLAVDDSYIPELKKCMQWVKRLGQNRNRGLGRCKFEFIEEEEVKA
ncbi:MAG: RAMP superfamily CRISPR-associated protein [Mangrovibacterium sp.]|nr:RAMP superfamily CRISPR-associated protein [Mangrovibacterium sp.]